MAGVVIEGMGILCNKTDSPSIFVMVWMSVVWGKREGGLPMLFLQWWKGWGGKRTSPLDSPMSKMGVVRSLQWWVGGRGKNRAERLGMGMWCRRTTTRISGGLVHIGFMFPHPENGRYTILGWLGEPKGAQEPIAGFWWGGEWWAG